MKKRRITSILLAAAMAASLAGCGSSSDSAAPATEAQQAGGETNAEAPAAPEGATTIEVWTEDRHDLEYVEAMIDKYNQSNEDGIFINLTVITEDYKNMLALAYNGGTAPDVVGANSLPLNTFADTGILMPLNEYIDSDETFQKVNEPYEHAYEGENTRNGNIYFVYSGMRSGVRVEYNKDLLEKHGYTEVPKDLDSYIEMAKTITEQSGGEYYGIGFTSSSPFERLLEMSAQVSGIFYYDYVNGKYDFSGYREILEKGQRFQSEEIAYPDQQGVDNMRALFAEGEFALWSNASQEASVFTNQIPITSFEWGVAEVPSLTGEIKGALQTTPAKAYGIVSTSEHKDLAWKVIQYFQSEDFLKGYLESGYCLPISTYMDKAIDKTKIGRLVDFSLLEYESVYPKPPVINLTGDDYRIVLWNAVMGYVDIDEAIEDLNTRYNEALEADIAAGTTKRLVISDYDPLHPSQGTMTYLDN
ncbi:ABC transporter substrate-binding protein [Lacrimispora sp. 210928-DFI.3.58]|uniref:ABC transporter substrate-binding protein n=1 Tax=Lacrimispora sp. 210928-DFI.3.58 TaxID=2883214 RepID=UPI001D0726F7|nr:extracellular solute-binding protein [Lacrimispora sp. 210928-DFI.3.58]MCB7318998.1 extracellular solute-binding protein [Lacrimispora sp. 210928-DFI.3.58]